MTRTDRAALVVATLAVSLCAPVRTAVACTCAVRDVAQQVATASTVFVGTVASTDDTSATFDVERVYKGDNPRTAPISNGGGAGSTCAIPFEEGRRYVVFASLQSATLSTGLCSGTTDDLSVADRLSVSAGPTGSPRAGPIVKVIVVTRRTAPIAAASALAALVAAALMFAVRTLGRRPRPIA